MSPRASRSHVWPWFAVLASVALVLSAVEAGARPGGGESYSGGSRSSGGGRGGGGGGGDGGELVWLVIRLIFYYPQVGVPLAIVVGVGWFALNRHRLTTWQSSSAPAPGVERGRAVEAARVDVEALRARDPEFSLVLFEDFVYRLFATAYRARHEEKQLAALAPYLSDSVRQAVAVREPVGVPFTHVVVGALRITGLQLPATSTGNATLSVLLDANLSAASSGASFFTQQAWTFSRSIEALSKPPSLADRFGCPSCGAPFSSGDTTRCDYCGEVVMGGRFDWQVVEVLVLQHEARPPLLNSTVVEQGGNDPTLFHPALRERWAALQRDDPAVTSAALQGRLLLMYQKLNQSWTSGELELARPFLSDGMFDYLDYWVRAYREQRQRNVLERMQLKRMLLVKVVRDRHFDAVTFRFWATGLDYTIELGSSRVVSGSATREREYSEYWTLIRGTQARGAPRETAVCPNCAAPLQTSMSGVCQHCSQHLTSGEFDFVLSKIEQDDSYAG
ncbi:MAG TPA: TIM44-like domain-containing protein [Polyangiaceae bacterium]|nr:TIM44-like domain-containing protein [Polyangiaceae bacterium]